MLEVKSSDLTAIHDSNSSQFIRASSMGSSCFVVDKEKLDFVRAQVANKPQPWTNAYNQMLKDSDKYGKYVSECHWFMNKWSHVIKGHALDHAILQTVWAGGSWARAGELIRHTTLGLWAPKDITQFESMLRNVQLPSCWDSGMILNLVIIEK
ncbi:hypothetical protein WAI453_000029 [Rhynchosporium graminicola]